LPITPKAVTPEFLAFFLAQGSVRNVLASKMQGATGRQRLPREVLDAFPITVPPLPEQQAIAGALAVVQRSQDSCARVIAATRRLKASLLQHLFTYGPVPFEEADRVPLKETEIGLVPEHWRVQPLRDLVDRPKYGLTATARQKDDGPRFLRITDIQNGMVKWDQVPSCMCSAEDRAKYALRAGDILVARIGATTGKTFLMREAPPAVFASYLIRIRAREGVDPGYLLRFTETAAYWEQINAAKGGRLKQGVNIPVLENLLVPVPPSELQREISSTLNVVEHKLATEEKHRDALARFIREGQGSGAREAVSGG
jgi:type I restriction enzyme S subunit